MINKPICFVDLETTGTNIETARIVEISVLKRYLPPEQTEEMKCSKINPIFPIPKEATEVHGITDEMVKDAPTFRQISKSLLDFISGCDFVGFNGNRYDFPILYNEFARAQINWDYSGSRFIDVGNIYKIKEERTLSAAVKFYLGRDHSQAHGAEADVRATAEVFFKMFDVYNDLPGNAEELESFSNFGAKLLDLSGKFKSDSEGRIVFAFGPHKDKPADSEPSFLNWMLEKDFPNDTKDLVRKILNK